MFNGFVWQTRTLEVRHDKLGVNGGEDLYGVGAVASGLSGGVGLGGAASVNGSGAGTPFSQVLPGPSSLLPRYPTTTAPPSSLAIPEPDPLDMLSSPLPSTLGGRSSPLPVHSPLLGQISTHSTGASQVAGERSRNLFVGNVSYPALSTHIPHADAELYPVTIPCTMAGPQRSVQTSGHDSKSRRCIR